MEDPRGERVYLERSGEKVIRKIAAMFAVTNNPFALNYNIQVERT